MPETIGQRHAGGTSAGRKTLVGQRVHERDDEAERHGQEEDADIGNDCVIDQGDDREGCRPNRHAGEDGIFAFERIAEPRRHQGAERQSERTHQHEHNAVRKGIAAIDKECRSHAEPDILAHIEQKPHRKQQGHPAQVGSVE